MPMTCPRCGGECERDEVDVGVGSIAAGPWGCPDCYWTEDVATRQFLDIEDEPRDEEP